MRCRVGDLAFTCSMQGLWVPPEYIGRMVEVVAVADCGDCCFGHCWRIRPLGWVPSDCPLGADSCFMYPDCLLRPIRGTDAQDKTAESRELEAA